jgi:cytochrome c2
MEPADFVWIEDKLISFLAHPQQVLPGTRMPFSGLSNVDDASNIVAYLASLEWIGPSSAVQALQVGVEGT